MFDLSIMSSGIENAQTQSDDNALIFLLLRLLLLFSEQSDLPYSLPLSFDSIEASPQILSHKMPHSNADKSCGHCAEVTCLRIWFVVHLAQIRVEKKPLNSKWDSAAFAL